MKRIGMLVPATNMAVENEAYFMYSNNIIKPNEITFFTSRIDYRTRYSDNKEQFLKEIAKNSMAAMYRMNTLRLDYIAFFCTSSAQVITDAKKQFNELGVLEPTKSIIEACKLINMKKCLLITPYNENIGSKIKYMLENVNINVVKDVHIDLVNSHEYIRYGFEELSGLIESIYNPKYENVVISCTNLPTMHLISELEKRLNTTIITSNSSMIWKILKDNSVLYDTKNNKLPKIFKEGIK